jgi:hypothetical protein
MAVSKVVLVAQAFTEGGELRGTYSTGVDVHHEPEDSVPLVVESALELSADVKDWSGGS